MKNNSLQPQIPCVIENGIVYGVKDIYRIIRDIGHVKYSEIIDDEITTQGEGYIMSVVANEQSATVIANQRLYLNVCGFDYLKIMTISQEEVHFDLVHSYRTLRLTPVPSLGQTDPMSEKPERYEDFSHFDEHHFAEIHLDDDEDLLDGD